MEGEQKPILHSEVRGVVIISLPEGDDISQGKTVCAAFTFGDQQPQQHQLQQHQQQPPQQQSPQQQPQHVLSDSSEVPFLSSRPRPRPRRWGLTYRKLGLKKFLSVTSLLGVLAFLWFRVPTLSYLDEQWEDGEDRAHVHRLYAKYVVSMPPEKTPSRSLISSEMLFDRDSTRRKLWERNMQNSAVNGSTVFPVKGNVYPDGLYYMQLLIGSPPKPYYLDIDSGSDLTWVQCNAPCASCAQGPHPLYSPKGAQLVDCRQPLCSQLQRGGKHGCSGSGQCDYEIEYGDSSSTMGVLVSDEVSVMLTNGTLAQTKATFGCSYDQQGSLAQSPAKTDGLIGLSSAKVALPAQLAAKGIAKNVVSHCLADGNAGGGYLFFGDELVPSWGMTWTPMVGKPYVDNYHASLAKLHYGGSTQRIDGNDLTRNDLVFDSGTSYTYLAPHIYSSLVLTVQESLVGSGLQQDANDKTLPLCWRGPSAFRSVTEASIYFKTLTLNFGNNWLLMSRTIDITPEGYLIVSAKGNVCFGILDSSGAGNDGYNIIGDISLRGYLVVYDNVQQRIGWMPSDCRKPPKARSFTYI